MNKFFKVFVPLSVATLMSFTMLTACDDGNSKNQSGTPSPDISGTPTPENPNPENPNPSWTTEKYDAIVAKMGATKNYTYTVTEDGKTDVYQIAGDKMRFRKDNATTNTIWYVEDNAYYQLKFEADQYYHKTKIAGFDIDSYIYNDIKNATVTDFDKSTNAYTVTMSNVSYSVQILDDSISFENDKKNILIDNIDKTKFTFPAQYDIKDDTDKQEPDDPTPPPVVDPDDPDDPNVTDEKIYTVDAKGNRTYNSKLLGETIKEILNTETNGKTLYNELTYNYGNYVDEVLFVVTEGDNIQIGCLAKYLNSNTRLDVIKIAKSRAEQLAADKQAWVNELSSGKGIDLHDFTRIDYDVSVEPNHHEELMQIMKKSLDKLATEGVRSDGLNTVGTPEERYANSEVLAVFEGKDGLDGHAGLGLGNFHSKILVGIIKDGNGTYMFVRMNVATSDFQSFEDSILNPDPMFKKYPFVVYKMDRAQELDKQFFETV